MEEPIEPSLNEKTANYDDAAHANDEKKKVILEACGQGDLDALRALAESQGGFLTDNIRQQAWPILLGLPPSHDKTESGSDGTPSSPSWESLPRHKDEDQVQLDVNRAFIYYPEHQTEAQLTHHKSLLSTLITSLLRTHPYLSYFQGYHDIAQVLLLTLPPPLHLPSLTHLSLLHIRDFMLPSLAPAIAQLRLIPDILKAADPPLWQHLSSTEPFFALSGTLTMYAHDITTLGEITRLFDVLLARDPVFTVYLFAAIIRSRRAELFDTPPDEPEMLHSILSKLPVPLDLEGLIAQAVALERDVPPRRLPSWRRGVSRWSVLKTGRGGGQQRREGGQGEGVEEQGRVWFERQVRELRWEEGKKKVGRWVWRRRRPVGMVGVAVLVGVLAVLLRRGPLPGPVVSGLGWVSGLLVRWWR
ncbi:rab-GTPase-TBC domain-containing protein [Parachaetomium inaequale]|uniref:Rab-GTPase-TBC domain-containing protein n=1 Tax=Parachaetomium inaequale TaxID=2588326 RepID=A0AAN6SQ27_9PEZI|nr:rab-GTPase-TBC domain-containing protein [Parachaetomium inaequale]